MTGQPRSMASGCPNRHRLNAGYLIASEPHGRGDDQANQRFEAGVSLRMAGSAGFCESHSPTKEDRVQHTDIEFAASASTALLPLITPTVPFDTANSPFPTIAMTNTRLYRAMLLDQLVGPDLAHQILTGHRDPLRVQYSSQYWIADAFVKWCAVSSKYRKVREMW